jgi:putative phosphoribosyl transferase
MMAPFVDSQSIVVPVGKDAIQGDLNIPEDSNAIVIFAHGSGSSRLSPRNKFVADILNEGGIATLLIDLLTPLEEEVDLRTARLRFDIPFLADRLIHVTDWLRRDSELAEFNIGYFGASTGAAAALVASAKGHGVKAIVSRGGRPDLAGQWLLKVRAPTLLIIGANDRQVIELNYEAASLLSAKHQIEIIPGAGHLFEESGSLEIVARLARGWFEEHLITSPSGNGSKLNRA